MFNKQKLGCIKFGKHSNVSVFNLSVVSQNPEHNQKEAFGSGNLKSVCAMTGETDIFLKVFICFSSWGYFQD